MDSNASMVRAYSDYNGNKRIVAPDNPGVAKVYSDYRDDKRNIARVYSNYSTPDLRIQSTSSLNSLPDRHIARAIVRSRDTALDRIDEYTDFVASSPTIFVPYSDRDLQKVRPITRTQSYQDRQMPTRHLRPGSLIRQPITQPPNSHPAANGPASVTVNQAPHNHSILGISGNNNSALSTSQPFSRPQGAQSSLAISSSQTLQNPQGSYSVIGLTASQTLPAPKGPTFISSSSNNIGPYKDQLERSSSDVPMSQKLEHKPLNSHSALTLSHSADANPTVSTPRLPAAQPAPVPELPSPIYASVSEITISSSNKSPANTSTGTTAMANKNTSTSTGPTTGLQETIEEEDPSALYSLPMKIKRAPGDGGSGRSRQFSQEGHSPPAPALPPHPPPLRLEPDKPPPVPKKMEPEQTKEDFQSGKKVEANESKTDTKHPDQSDTESLSYANAGT